MLKKCIQEFSRQINELRITAYIILHHSAHYIERASTLEKCSFTF